LERYEIHRNWFISLPYLYQDLVEHLRKTLPLLSDEFMTVLTDTREFGLTAKDASTLLVLDDGDRLDYYIDVVQMLRSTLVDEPATHARIGKVAGNW
jgi:aspartyl-tRNA(Asn)/glutamyl-tRNA(Gln) amidotransferase subunit B